MDTTISQKLRYRIFECSGEDPQHPVSELLSSSPHSTGWQSQRFCSFPQSITFQFLTPINLKQIQFLSHESKISSKIELFTTTADTKQPLPSSELKFKKLGFLCLDPNDASNYQLRELKTVYVEAPCLYLRVLFHKCHVNKMNHFNQVGLIAIAAYGETLGDSPQRSLTHSVERKERTATASPVNNAVLNGVAAKRIKELEELKQRAAENEDFEEAQRLKHEIVKIRNIAMQVQKYEDKLGIAVQNEDYETANLLQKEIDKLKDALAMLAFGNRGKQPRKIKTLQTQNSSEQKSQKGSLLEIPDGKQLRQRLSVKESRQRNSSTQMSETGEYMEEMKIDNAGDDDYFTQSADDSENVRQTSHRIAHDDKIIPALAKKNTEVLEEHPSKNNLPQEAEELSPPQQRLAEPLAPIVGAEMCKKIFSKHWNLREEALKTLIEELPKENRSQVINYTEPPVAFIALMGIVSYTIGDRINQVAARSMTLLKNLMAKKAPITMKSELSGYIDVIMVSLLEKIGDNNNPRGRDQAEDVILTMAKNPLITCSYCVTQLAKKQKVAQPLKHITARAKLLHTFVKEYKINNHDVPYHPVVEFAVEKLEHPNAEVRSLIVALLVEIYSVVGDKIKGDLDGMKLASLEMLQKEFDSVAPRTIGTSPVKGTGKLAPTPAKTSGKTLDEKPSAGKLEGKPGTSNLGELRGKGAPPKIDVKDIKLGDTKEIKDIKLGNTKEIKDVKDVKKGENVQQPKQAGKK